jgi:hypothetical protein
MRAQSLGERVRNWWNKPAGMGSLDQKPNPSGSYGPSQGDVVKGVGQAAATYAAPALSETAPAINAMSKVPQRLRAGATGAMEGAAAGEAIANLPLVNKLPYAREIGGGAGALGGGIYGLTTSKDLTLDLLGKAGRAWRGEDAPAETLAQKMMSGGTSSAGSPSVASTATSDAPSTGGPTINVDSNGIRWASHPSSPNPVSIPRGIPDAQVDAYAMQKLQEQAQMTAKLKGSFTPASGSPTIVSPEGAAQIKGMNTAALGSPGFDLDWGPGQQTLAKKVQKITGGGK